MSSDQHVEAGDDRHDDEQPDREARWPTTVPPERGGITTSPPHAVPTVTPGEPGAQPPTEQGHAESAASTAQESRSASSEPEGADDDTPSSGT